MRSANNAGPKGARTIPDIDESLVARLLATQFPDWAALPLARISPGGWDNRTFRLGTDMLVRIPSAPAYALQIEKEQRWLPQLAPRLPLRIPEPLALGRAGHGLPWAWSVYRWLPGEAAATGRVAALPVFARDLAHFLAALHRIDADGGPQPGIDNFHRGGGLAVYDAQARQAIELLKHRIDAAAAIMVWERAIRSTWCYPPRWVHGDISPGNLLVVDGALSAVIDFGQLAIGDPACDLAIAWTFFFGESRDAFHSQLELDHDTWDRGRGWALWKALVVAAGLADAIAQDKQHCWKVIDEILLDHRHTGN